MSTPEFKYPGPVASATTTAFLSVFFVYLVLEGAVRKWVAPSQGPALFVLKDVLLLCAVTSYGMHQIVSKRRARTVLSTFEVSLLALWVIYFSGSAIGSGLTTINLVGLRYYLVALPLIMLIPRSVGSRARFVWLLRTYLFLAVPVCILGLVQFASSPDALINRYAWETARVATFQGGTARITGTFSYISPFTAYLQFMVFAAWGLLLLERKPWRRAFAGLALTLLQINVVLTGSRAPLFLTVALALFFVADLTISILNRRGQLATLTVTLLIITVGVFQAVTPFMLVAERNVRAGDAEQRIQGFLLMPMYTLSEASLLGTGIGTAFMGVRELGWGYETAEFDEVTVDRVGTETGAVGYILALVVKIYFLRLTIITLRRAGRKKLEQQHLRVALLLALCFQLSQLWAIPVYSSVANVFYFSSLGLVVWARSALPLVEEARGRH